MGTRWCRLLLTGGQCSVRLGVGPRSLGAPLPVVLQLCPDWALVPTRCGFEPCGLPWQLPGSGWLSRQGLDGQPLARGRAGLTKCDQNPLLPYTPSASCPLPISCKTTAFIQKPTNVGREAGGPEWYRTCLWLGACPGFYLRASWALCSSVDACRALRPGVRGGPWPLRLCLLMLNSASFPYCARVLEL